jgi:hypothetical protein
MEPRTTLPADTCCQRFEIYMAASGKTQAEDTVKTSLLLHAIGPEGLETFNAFTFTEQSKYESTLSKFHAYFVPIEGQSYLRKASFL